MSRTVVLTILINTGAHGDFVAGKPVVVDARPEPWLWRMWRKLCPRKSSGKAVLTSNIGVEADADTFKLLVGVTATAGSIDLIPACRSPAVEESYTV